MGSDVLVEAGVRTQLGVVLLPAIQEHLLEPNRSKCLMRNVLTSTNRRSPGSKRPAARSADWGGSLHVPDHDADGPPISRRGGITRQAGEEHVSCSVDGRRDIRVHTFLKPCLAMTLC